MKSLYLETNSGISGDMTVAALLDLGADEAKLLKVLDSIDAEGFDIKISKVKKSGLDCLDFNVILDVTHDGHDHDMDYLYGHLGEKSHNHSHTHEHRGMAEINEILDQTQMTEKARKIADKIFGVLAKAESEVHGVPVDEVHFHEVGAIDSIVDIVSVAVCLDDLGIDDIIVPKLYDGQGTVRCQHGILPIPVPAVANIVSAHDIALEIIDINGELVTPTGAAIAAAVRTKDKLPQQFKIEKIGMGAGKRETGLAGFLRAIIIEDC